MTTLTPNSHPNVIISKDTARFVSNTHVVLLSPEHTSIDVCMINTDSNP